MITRRRKLRRRSWGFVRACRKLFCFPFGLGFGGLTDWSIGLRAQANYSRRRKWCEIEMGCSGLLVDIYEYKKKKHPVGGESHEISLGHVEYWKEGLTEYYIK